MGVVRATAAVLLLAALAAPLAAQSRLPEDPELHEPYLAWDRGDYPEAMRGYLRVLEGPRGRALATEVAVLTGELHPVLEIAPDGGRLEMGEDGRYATFEVTEDGAVVTKVVAIPQGRIVATVPGGVTALLAGGRIAYARPRTTDDVAAARAALDAAPDPLRRERAQLALRLAELRGAEVRIRSLAEGGETTVRTDGWGPLQLAATGELLVALAVPPAAGAAEALVLGEGAPRPLGAAVAGALLPVPGGRWVVGPGGGVRRDELLLMDAVTGVVRGFPGRRSPAVSADGSTLAMVTTREGEHALEVLRLGVDDEPRVILRGTAPLDRPALNPNGTLVAYQKRPIRDWEVFLLPTDGGEETRLSREIQHDRMPRFLGAGTVLAAKGEARHYRAYVYDRIGSEPLRLFHNNTLRTISPEYEWVPTPDGQHVLVVAERDGDTVSPERGVYLVDRTRSVGLSDVRARLEESLSRELDLRARGARAFQPIGDEVRRRVAEVSVARIRAYADDLYRLGSRHVTMPGNAAAIEVLSERLRSFGYEPELQWFDARGVRTANVIARLAGTSDPELVYTVGSHFDSVEEGPGSDDNGSGTSALLEVARVLRAHPQPATIELAFFTAEESGLLGAREYVRRALAEGKRIQAALNNDMIGWTNDHRLDNTVRYSNAGIRDLQHAAAISYSELITYDALYYKNTDAHAFYDAFGDVVGGIGSYPVLGNPNYHRATDRIETVNHRLVAEVAKATLATVMALASSPARPAGLEARALSPAQGEVEIELSWTPAAERDVTEYVVRFTDRSGALREERVAFGRDASPAERPSVRLRDVRPGGAISLKAVDASGLESWDRATIAAPD